MIHRELYIEALKEFIDKPQIKILTGIRRSGKSSVLMILKEELTARGVTSQQIIHINLESFQFSELKDVQELYKHISQKALDGKESTCLLMKYKKCPGGKKLSTLFWLI